MTRMHRGSRRGALTLALGLGLLTAVTAAAPARSADPFLRRTATVEVVERAGPAVVNITTERVVEVRDPFPGLLYNPYRDRFFDDFPERRTQRTVQNLGSGVIISPQGHVLTNEHVVSQASRIFITLADGREFEVDVVGADPTNDVAVLLARSEEPLPWIEPGSSDDVMVGEPVIAIGNPFGLSNTVTTGVISAVNRSVRTEQHTFHGFLQTDASINPGNSGGPLLNAEGALIGINSAIYNGAEGIGFAIPIDVARRVVAELIEHGEVLPVTLGISFQDLDPALAQVMGMPPDVRGALINRVHPGGAAEREGLRRGDVISKLDGTRITSARQLYEMLETTTPDQRLAVQLWRDGSTLERTLVAERIPEDVAGELASRLLGLRLEMRPEGAYVVTQVRNGSPGQRVGLQRGDWLLAVNGLRLDGEPALRRAMLDLRGRDRALAVVQRGPGRYHLTIPLR